MGEPSVKNKIASFEAYNKQLSNTMTPPREKSKSIPADAYSSPPNDATRRYPVTNAQPNVPGELEDGESVVSSTSKASKNRRNRLQGSSPLRAEEEPTRNSQYAQRRKLRQQQRQRGKADSFAARPVANGSVPAGQPTGSQQPLPYHPSAFSRRLQSPDPPESPKVSSNRRFVHTISNESSNEEVGKSSSGEGEPPKGGDLLSPNRRLSPARIAKAYRMQRMRQAAEESSSTQRAPSTPQRSTPSPLSLQLPGGPTSPRTPQTYRGSYEDDDTQFNSVGNAYTGDDDATQTSVRQIVTGSNTSQGGSRNGRDESLRSQGVHRNIHGNGIDNDLAATFGYDDNAKQSWVEHGEHQDGVVLRMASSSDYDSDGNAKSDVNGRSAGARGANRSLPSPPDSAMKAFLNQSNRSSRLDDDDRTYDYGSINDESTHASFDTQKRELERKAKQTSEKQASVGFVPNEATSPLINRDDLNYYKESLDSGVTKAAAGVLAAGAVGGIVLGPVGILLGVAAVGIGVGAMQIPEEQRNNVKEKATNAIFQATDKISTGCASACAQSGVIDQLPPEMTKCYSPTDGEDGTDGTITDQDVNDNASVRSSKGHATGENANGNFNTAMRGLIPEGNGRKSASPARRAACLRDVRIVPVNQIHGLPPAQQPRAWLDVMASANTTMDEKNEAMEEIQILSKDKKHARVFLDEGILDSLMWIINNHLSKVNNSALVSPAEVSAARLAASCCVTLGKVHCALVHTGGDLLLMSMYEHGKVPEDRQLAQMLYETPYHVRVTKTPDPSIVQPGKEVFVLKSLTMPQAQELATSLVELAAGQ